MSRGGDEPHAHTVRLELADEPGELLRALEPVVDDGGDLLSIRYERADVTPRGRIPVEVDVAATPDQFVAIVAGLRGAGIDVVQAETERYSESFTVVLSGRLIEAGLSETVTRIRAESDVPITELSLSAPGGTRDVSSVRLTGSTPKGEVERAMGVVRDVAADEGLRLIELDGGTGGDS
jgi:ACT domain-containing protein